MARPFTAFLLAATLPAGLAGCGLILGLDEFVDASVGAGSGSGGGGGGSGACEPGESRACYSGPMGTDGVGICQGGQQQCSGDGTGFGLCEGEVVPAVEDCAVRGDEDCDGVPCSDALWAKLYGDVELQQAYAVAVDTEGNILVAGTLRGSADFGGGPRVSAGLGDVFLAKLDAAGNHIWSARFGDGSDQQASSIAVDPEGNVFVAGGFRGILNLGGGNLVSAGEVDIWVAKFAPDGAHVWSKRFGDAASQGNVRIAVDHLGDVILAGSYQGTLNFGDGNLVNSTNHTDIYVAKLDVDGTAEWSSRFGDSSPQELYAVAVDAAGSVYLGGTLYGSVNFGGITLSGSGVAYLAKLDTFGAHVWSRTIGESSSIKALATDAAGEVSVTGTFTGALNFGSAQLLQPGGGRDLFVVRLNSAGTYRWGQALGSTFDDDVSSMDVSTAKDVVLSFWSVGDLSFEGHGFPASTRSLLKLSADGQYAWGKSFGDLQAFFIARVAVDPTSGEIVMAGSQTGEIDYGLGPLTPVGSSDALVVKLAP